jgi:hypothetical protein
VKQGIFTGYYGFFVVFGFFTGEFFYFCNKNVVDDKIVV